LNALPTTKRIVAIENPAVLKLDKTRLVVVREGLPDGMVPLEDLAVLILDYAQITITVPLLAALAEAEVAVIVANAKHLPTCAYLPFAAHHQHALIVRKQAAAGEPTKKRMWQQITQAKIRNQGAVLDEMKVSLRARGGGRTFAQMAADVASGDTGNVEAVAAARYFPALFGPGFIREPEREDLTNSMLNYGYALLRAATARAITAAGLHPAFGVFHHNRFDPYALADDAMEPLRPLVDLLVRRYEGPAEPGLTPAAKRYLYPVLTSTVSLNGERLPLFAGLEQYAANVRRCFLAEGKRLDCPEGLQLP
jgi:CRISPR-associated protein Cas1